MARLGKDNILDTYNIIPDTSKDELKDYIYELEEEPQSLDEAIEESIEEMQETQELPQEEVKEMPKISNEDIPMSILERIVKVEEKNIKFQTASLQIQQTNALILSKVVETQKDQEKSQKSIKDHQNKTSFIVIALVIMASYIVGTQHAKLYPYFSDAYETFKTVKNATPQGKVIGGND